jgi:hypothetical protein
LSRYFSLPLVSYWNFFLFCNSRGTHITSWDSSSSS